MEQLNVVIALTIEKRNSGLLEETVKKIQNDSNFSPIPHNSQLLLKRIKKIEKLWISFSVVFFFLWLVLITIFFLLPYNSKIINQNNIGFENMQLNFDLKLNHVGRIKYNKKISDLALLKRKADGIVNVNIDNNFVEFKALKTGETNITFIANGINQSEIINVIVEDNS